MKELQSEMQELIAAAEEMLKVAYIEGSGWDLGIRLSNAIAAARASEGGWVACKQELPPVGMRVLGCKGADHMEGMELVDNDVDNPFFIYLSDGDGPVLNVKFWQPLPSPPLSVETPGGSK